MASTFLSLHYHLVFSTKDRRPSICPDWRSRLHNYIGGTVNGLGGICQQVGGGADHVHLLVGLKATHCLADSMCELKKASSAWARVLDYIRRQEEHHAHREFASELKELLEKHGVAYDTRYLL